MRNDLTTTIEEYTMKYLVTNTGANRQQRNASMYGDKTSSSKKPGKMQNKVIARANKVFAGRDKINRLFLRAGIAINL